MPKRFVSAATLAAALVFCSLSSSQAGSSPGCEGLPGYEQLQIAVRAAVSEGKEKNAGLGNHMWGAVVNRDGVVCAVAFSGATRSDQWPGSRFIAAQKASTANAFSNSTLALSTANLFTATQPGGSLYGLINTAPLNPEAAFAGEPEDFGQPNDPMVGKRVGGVVVFGGGLPLYDKDRKILGGLGVSGDTACADHVVAWKMRHALKLDNLPGGVAPSSDDNLMLDIRNGKSVSGFGHPGCGASSDVVIKRLIKTHPNPKIQKTVGRH